MPVQSSAFSNFDPTRVPSPCFVVDEVSLEHNLQILADVQLQAGVNILLALKAFSMFHFGPLVGRYLRGTCASGVHEARMGREFFPGDVHTFSPAYSAASLAEVLQVSDHVVFNSVNQWQRFQEQALASQAIRPQQRFGLRINPEHSEGHVAKYDPCTENSRLGIKAHQLRGFDWTNISGVHFHTLCEHGLAPLERTLAAVEEKFGQWLSALKWVNFGGGHLITDPDYDRAGLIARAIQFQDKFDVKVYLEPGEAIAVRTGVLVSEVLDVNETEGVAILDCSATCHMPDTLEMPYRAGVFNASRAGVRSHSYFLGGLSCLAGDQMGAYSFTAPLEPGQRLMFDDMSHYTMVKTTTFNGVPHPALAVWNSETDDLQVIKKFGCEDFRVRLS